MIDSNIKRRAAETGRDIPQELRQASSIKEINHGVAKLTYLADLVASVHNSPPSGVNAVSEPFYSLCRWSIEVGILGDNG